MPDSKTGYREFKKGMRVVMVLHKNEHKIHVQPGAKGRVTQVLNMPDDGCSAVGVVWDDGTITGHTVPPDLMQIDGMASSVTQYNAKNEGGPIIIP